MVRVKDLTELTVADCWREVKSEEDWWGDLREESLHLVKRLLESGMEEDLLEQLRVGRYRRTELRRGYRNGHYHRSLLVEWGLIENLRVPRDREGEFQPQVLERYQRRQQRVNGLIREMFLAGVSTRRVGEVLEPILGEKVSPQTVSRVLRSLDAAVVSFHHRLLEDEYCYLFVDGICLKAKEADGVKKKRVLCAYGVTLEGKRQLIDFRQATGESQASWEAFLRDLYERGLRGNKLRLIVTDGSTGLHSALDTVFPYVLRQRCWVHKLRNVEAKLPKKVHQECLGGVKTIYQAESKREAVANFRRWAQEWRGRYPKAVRCVEEDLEELLNFLACPKLHWRKVRTTNAIERTFREVRRRTRPMSCFENRESVERIIFGIVHYLNAKWKDKPVPQFTQNT
jgi:putative transposase